MKKKYIVILAGSPRGGDETWNSLYQNVLDPLQADLAIATSRDYVNQNLSLFQKADFQWIFEDYKDYLGYYSNNYSEKAINYLNLGKGTGLLESGSIHFIFKDFILKNYIEILKNYEYIIYTRFDQFYTDIHIEGKPDKILIPKGEDYFGVCDRHAVIPCKFITQYLGICDYIDSTATSRYPSDYLNCETVYFNQLQENGLSDNIERIDRFQFTASLKKDKTNWRISKYRLYGYKDLYIKYPDEFVASMQNLLNKKNNNNNNTLYKMSRLSCNYYYICLRRFLGGLVNKR
jgi:hypothetical protein